MVSTSASLELTIFQLFKFLVHFLKFFFLFLNYRIFFSNFFFFLRNDLIELVKIFPLNPCFLFNLSHFLVHDDIFGPLRGIFLIKHLEFLNVGNFEIFSFRLPDSCMVVDVKFSFDSLVSRQFQAKVFFLEVKDHGNHLDEVMADILIRLDFLFDLLSSNIFS